MTTPLLLQAIDRYIAIARDRSADQADGPFRHHVIGTLQDLQTAAEDSPHRSRALGGGPDGDLKGESFVLMVGGVRFTHFHGVTPFEFETELDANHLSIRYLIQGESTYTTNNALIARAQAGDYIFRINKSPLIRISTSANYRALLISIPIPSERRFSVNGAADASQQIQQYLDNGFIVTGQSSLWGAHIAYALNYAIEGATASANDNAPDQVLNEFLYLLCCQELAARVRSRDADQQYTVVPLKLKIAETFVIAHAAQAPSVEDVAAEARLSVRNLHALFMKFRGTSPSEFIREHRLAGVRAALRSAKGGATVSQIAISWSYHNFGNFAAAYKKRFGELPSETLGRAG